MKQGKRNILITGGTNGIGRAIAENFAQKGDHVTVWGQDPTRIADINSDQTNGITAESVNVSNPTEVQQAVGKLVAKWTNVDVLVNAAGFVKTFTTETPFEEAVERWNELLAVNLTGSFLVAQAVAKHLTRPGGRIITIGSVAGFTGSMLPGGIGYAAAKSGLSGLTLALSRELGPQGITVNEVAPGFIERTGITSAYAPDAVDRIVGQTTVGHAGSAADIAAAVAYLASPDAGFVNGEIHHVNGGWLPGR